MVKKTTKHLHSSHVYLQLNIKSTFQASITRFYILPDRCLGTIKQATNVLGNDKQLHFCQNNLCSVHPVCCFCLSSQIKYVNNYVFFKLEIKATILYLRPSMTSCNLYLSLLKILRLKYIVCDIESILNSHIDMKWFSLKQLNAISLY